MLLRFLDISRNAQRKSLVAISRGQKPHIAESLLADLILSSWKKGGLGDFPANTPENVRHARSVQQRNYRERKASRKAARHA